MKFNKKNIISLINTSNNFQGELIEDNQKHWKALIEGDYKDMTKTEVGFNQTQIKQLVDIVRTIIREEVPPMVRTIIKEEVPPMVEKIVDKKLDPIKKDLEAIKNCPTIKKELNQNNK